MKILMLASLAESLSNFRGPLIKDLLAEGHTVCVGAPDIGPELRSEFLRLGVEAHDTPLQRNRISIRADLAYLRFLIRLTKDVKPDLVLTYTVKPNIWGAFSASLSGVTSVAMVTGLGYVFVSSGGSLKSRFSRWIARKLYRAATWCNTRVIFQNPDDRDDFLAQGCLSDASKVGIVNGSGVDLSHYHRVPLPDAPVFVMIARLLVSKGVHEFAQAAGVVRASHPNARFVLIGPHDEGPDAITPEEINSLTGEDGPLEWRGPLRDVRPAIGAAAVYVLPSYREGTPRSVLEAMAMGRPIVTSDAPGCRETIRDGIEGFLVPPRDPTALAKAMERFILDPDLIARMGEAAHTRAVEKYAIERVNRQTIDLLGLDADEPSNI